MNQNQQKPKLKLRGKCPRNDHPYMHASRSTKLEILDIRDSFSHLFVQVVDFMFGGFNSFLSQSIPRNMGRWKEIDIRARISSCRNFSISRKKEKKSGEINLITLILSC